MIGFIAGVLITITRTTMRGDRPTRCGEIAVGLAGVNAFVSFLAYMLIRKD